MEVLDQEALLGIARQLAVARLIAKYLKEYGELIEKEFKELLRRMRE